jgi:hypothetical protein
VVITVVVVTVVVMMILCQLSQPLIPANLLCLQSPQVRRAWARRLAARRKQFQQRFWNTDEAPGLPTGDDHGGLCTPYASLDDNAL